MEKTKYSAIDLHQHSKYSYEAPKATLLVKDILQYYRQLGETKFERVNVDGKEVLINKKVKLDYKDLFVNLAKMILIGVLSLGLSFVIAKAISSYLVLPDFFLEIIKIIAVCIVLSISYIGLSLVFKIGYVDELKQRVLSKIMK